MPDMKRRAMTSAHASEVKTSGHINEQHFAELIGGQVNRGSHKDKKDVIDKQHRSHSVKAGTWWQVFLYSRERLLTNTIFQGIGSVADLMVACIDAYPEQYSNYLSNKIEAKRRLQPAMRSLLEELSQPKILGAFLNKALFDGGNADFLSVYLGPAKDNKETKEFNIYYKDDVVDALLSNIELRNSKARKNNEMDDQKVTFRSNLQRKNIGEIEDRHDSSGHYREMKFRLNAHGVVHILNSHINTRQRLSTQIIAFGRAIRMLNYKL